MCWLTTAPLSPPAAPLPHPTTGRVTWGLQAALLICIAAAAATQCIHSFKSTLWAHGAVVVALGMVNCFN